MTVEQRLTADELVAAHAAGRLPEPVALVVATHLALSPASRRRYACYEAAGGVLLERIAPAPLAPDAWARLCARLDDADRAPPPRPAAAAAAGSPNLPRPLRDRLPGPLEGLRWRSLGGTAVADLDLGAPGPHRTSLIWVRAGHAFPRHTHEGTELALCLEGGFSDQRGRYLRGDLSIADETVEHEMVAEPERDWLWLRVLDGGLRFTGPHGPLFGSFWDA